MSEEINCKFCNKPVNIYKIHKNITISNIAQNPSILYFCNTKCKSNWIYQVQEKGNYLRKTGKYLNQLEENYFRETGKFPYLEEENKVTIKEYDEWLNEKFEYLKRELEQIKQSNNEKNERQEQLKIILEQIKRLNNEKNEQLIKLIDKSLNQIKEGVVLK